MPQSRCFAPKVLVYLQWSGTYMFSRHEFTGFLYMFHQETEWVLFVFSPK